MATYEAVSGNFQSMSTYAWQAPWKIAVSPFRVAPRVYYVGNEWVGIYLVDTEEGLILVDTAVAENTYLDVYKRQDRDDPIDFGHPRIRKCKETRTVVRNTVNGILVLH